MNYYLKHQLLSFSAFVEFNVGYRMASANMTSRGQRMICSKRKARGFSTGVDHTPLSYCNEIRLSPNLFFGLSAYSLSPFVNNGLFCRSCWRQSASQKYVLFSQIWLRSVRRFSLKDFIASSITGSWQVANASSITRKVRLQKLHLHRNTNGGRNHLYPHSYFQAIMACLTCSRSLCAEGCTSHNSLDKYTV